MDPAAFQFLTGRPWGRADQERNALVGYVDRLAADNLRREEEQNARLREALGQTWPVQMVKSAVSAMALPGDVYAGRVDPNSDEAIKRSADLAGLLTLGAGVTPAARNELRMGIKAYHGTTHDFDNFDLSKFGTGEKSSAIGRGVYLSADENVAKRYANLLSEANSYGYNNHKGLSVGQVYDHVKKDFPDVDYPTFNRALIDLRFGSPETKFPVSSTQEAIRKAISFEPSGKVYEVDINTSPDRILQWYKTVDKQPDVVRKGLMSLGADPKSIADDAFRALPMSEADKSKVLLELGIDGIKYPDAAMRSKSLKPRGPSNYVIFNDKLITILRKYGVNSVSALPAAALVELGITQEEADRL